MTNIKEYYKNKEKFNIKEYYNLIKDSIDKDCIIWKYKNEKEIASLVVYHYVFEPLEYLPYLLYTSITNDDRGEILKLFREDIKEYKTTDKRLIGWNEDVASWLNRNYYLEDENKLNDLKKELDSKENKESKDQENFEM